MYVIYVIPLCTMCLTWYLHNVDLYLLTRSPNFASPHAFLLNVLYSSRNRPI